MKYAQINEHFDIRFKNLPTIINNNRFLMKKFK